MEAGKKKEKADIWAIAGGKGGTGKSFILSSIGTHLAEGGKKVILVDADLGGANLHSFLGVNKPKKSLTDFFENKVPLSELVENVGNGNLGLITGNFNSLYSTAIKHHQKLKFFRQIKKLDADYVLIDLGAGSHINTVDTFLLADTMMVIVVPEKPAIENMYEFTKKALFRRLSISFGVHGLKDLFAGAWENRASHKIGNLRDFMDFLANSSEKAREIIDFEISNFHIHIVVNQARNIQDRSVGFSVKSLFMKYLGFTFQYSGCIWYDDTVWNCIRKGHNFMELCRTSKCAVEIMKLTKNLREGAHLK
jgi:flagellar biosynthesis protein FlhG